MTAPGRIRIEPARDLTPEEREVELRATENLERNLPRLVEEYRARYGTEVSTDNARDIVSPDYAESNEAKTRWSRATQRPAAALAEHLYYEAIRNPNPARHPVVIMTAGGTGAGKTTALRNLRNWRGKRDSSTTAISGANGPAWRRSTPRAALETRCGSCLYSANPSRLSSTECFRVLWMRAARSI